MWGTDGRTDVQITPVFYRTSSPPVAPGAAAQKEDKREDKTKMEGKLQWKKNESKTRLERA